MLKIINIIVISSLIIFVLMMGLYAFLIYQGAKGLENEQTTSSIKESKERGRFVQLYETDSNAYHINGVKLVIDEVWLERLHNWCYFKMYFRVFENDRLYEGVLPFSFNYLGYNVYPGTLLEERDRGYGYYSYEEEVVKKSFYELRFSNDTTKCIKIFIPHSVK